MSGISNLPRPGRLGRAALLLGVAAATVGGMVLSAGAAQALVGTSPGAVQLSPASGPTSDRPTWSTTTACASGFQGSAVLREVHADGVSTNSVSPVVNGTAAPFNGTFQGTMAQVQFFGGIANGGTQELVVICFSGQSLTGSSDPEQDIFVTYSADGSTYSTSSTQSTTTTLTGSPNPVKVCTTVTLTATETAADGSHPAGSIQFMHGTKPIGSPVAVNASGVATTTTTFFIPRKENLSAVFTPANATVFIGSTGTFTETVTW
jgi:hypothetical protein